MLKKVSKFLLILLIISVLLAPVLGYAIYKYPTLFGFAPPREAIIDNNQNLPQTFTGQYDLINLVPKRVEVPPQFKNGQLAQERTINLPQNFEISVFAGGLKEPRFMAVGPNNSVFVTDKGNGTVYMLKDANADNIADGLITVDSGLRVPHGIEYHNKNLYVGEEHQVVIYRNIDENGGFESKETLVANLPAGNALGGGGHRTRTVKVGPDQKLYVAVGSSCNVCEEENPKRAAIIRYNLDGTGEEVFARGLRNTVGFVFDKNRRIWGVDNGRDLIGDDIPPEEINVIQIGNHYGWPYCYGKGIANPEYPDKAEFCERSSTYPEFELQAHSAPLGLDFATWSILENNLFIAYHGSWNRTVPTGYKVVRIDVTNQFNNIANFATGWITEEGTVWGRPVDVKFYKNNSILISDDHAGVIYSVRFSE